MQKQPKILNYKNLNKEKYEYLQPHKTQNGYYQSICNYRLTQNQVLPFYFETPKLKTTSGIVRIDNQYYIDLELPQSGDGGLFYDFLIKNDENNISICHSNSKEWFNQLMPLNIIENYYKTAILLRSNGQLPILRIKIPSYKGTILTEIFNVRKEKISDITCIQEGDYIVGIIEYTGLKFMKQNFSPCYDLQKIKIFKDNNFRAIPSGYIFSDTNEDINLHTIYDKEKDSLLDHPIENFSNKESINNTNEYKTIDIKKPLPIKLTNIITDTPEPNLNNNNNNTSSNSPEPIIKKSSMNEPTINEPTINENTIKSIDIDINKKNNNLNKKSLYDIIKETTLDSLYMDDKLFLNNNKLIKNNNMNNDDKNDDDNEEDGEDNEEGEDGEDNEEGEDGEDNEEGEDEIIIGEEEIDNNEDEDDYDTDNNEDDYDTNDTDDEDSNNDIDYNTLNDLEVIEFDE